MNKKNIRSKVVKDSLLDYETLASSLKENTASAVKSLLNEAVRESFAKLLSEDEDSDYKEDEVEDTNLDDNGLETDAETSDAETTDDGVENADEEGMDAETDDLDGGVAATDDEADESGDEDEWAEYDKYKVGEDEYDFTNAQDEEIVKVYKLLKNGDELVVNQEDDKLHLQDNESGTEYLIDLNGLSTDTSEGNVEDDNSFDTNEFDDMNESQERLFELVLEYDSNVGYTDNYQNKDVMTTDGMAEPGKNVNDWDKGVPHGAEKPWSSRSPKNDDAPFNDKEGKKVEEDVDLDAPQIDECGDGEPMEEATNVGGFVQQNTTSKSHVPTSSGRNARNASKGGIKVKGTTTPRYAASEETNESFKRRLNKIVRENKEMVNALSEFRTALKEAAVVNYNLGKIITLISENATTKDEKEEIIKRFAKEAKTVDESNRLFESISNDLKKSNKMNINEEKTLVAGSSNKINETPIYKSKEVLESLDLMHRMMK